MYMKLLYALHWNSRVFAAKKVVKKGLILKQRTRAKLYAYGLPRYVLKQMIVVCLKGAKVLKLVVHLAHGRLFTMGSHKVLF